MIPGAIVHPRSSWEQAAHPVTGPVSPTAQIDTAVIHYTAADNLIDGDPGEHAANLPAYIAAMQRAYVTQRGYSLGYRWAVDWLGGVWQIRGWEFKSAANAGHNDHTEPILMLVDGADGATPEAAAAVRTIIAESQRRSGRTFKITGHGQLSGAATLCPGVGLRAQIAAGVFAPIIAAPTPQPPGDDDMPLIAYIAKPPAEAGPNAPWLAVIDGDVRYATSTDAQRITDHQQLNSEQYGWLLKSAGLS